MIRSRFKKFIFHFSFFILHFAFLASMAHAADLYVQSVKAPIFSSPSMGSPKVVDASKGDQLKELEKKGDWHKVVYKDKTGWVSRLLVASKPPAGKVSLLEETDEKLEKGARKRASAFTTAAAARGLAEERARASDKYRVDHRGVEWMEALKVSDEESLKFLEKGVGR